MHAVMYGWCVTVMSVVGNITQKKKQYSWSSKFQDKFKNAWSLGSQLAVDEVFSLLSFHKDMFSIVFFLL